MAGKSKAYNGHRNWNHWNVSLWINNDEGLYRTALDCIRATNNRDAAVREFLTMLPSKTPDGAPYSSSTVRAAIKWMEK